MPILKADHARDGFSSANAALAPLLVIVLYRWSDDVSTSALGKRSKNGVGSCIGGREGGETGLTGTSGACACDSRLSKSLLRQYLPHSLDARVLMVWHQSCAHTHLQPHGVHVAHQHVHTQRQHLRPSWGKIEIRLEVP